MSDVACPWCAVGLGSLNQAMAAFSDKADFEVHFRAFELNPHMPIGGQDAMEHLMEKYGLSLDQVKANQVQIRARAAEVGFNFDPDGRKRVYNTFNSHRLLFMAAYELDLHKQAALKTELLNTYFCLGVSLDDEQNILDAVVRAGLDPIRAQVILSGDEFREEVNQELQRYKSMGISSVPSLILNDQYLLQGALPPDELLNAFAKLVIS